MNAVDAGICGIKTNADKDPKQITGDQNGESEMLRLEAKRDDQEQPANSGSGGWCYLFELSCTRNFFAPHLLTTGERWKTAMQEKGWS